MLAFYRQYAYFRYGYKNSTIMKPHLTNCLWTALITLALSACGGRTSTLSVTVEGDGWSKLKTDSMNLTWIQDNPGNKLMPVALFPDAPDKLIEQLHLQEGIPSSVSTFLLEKGGKLILFDTGNGAPDSRLARRLAYLNTSPENIRYIYLTHFPGDHIGGMMRGDTVVFPNAEVYASKAEYEAWMQMPKEQNALVVKTMEAYKDRLHLFEFGDTLPGGVVALDAAGHTPGHTAYRAGQFLIVGDLMHGVALQREHPDICASFDMDKGASATARKRIMQYAEDNDLRMAGMHFPAPGFLMK